MIKRVLAGAMLAACASLAVAQDEPKNSRDYPTIERVQFVESCVRQHPDRSRQEMLYKCSCAMDKITTQLTYDEYVEASTAFFASQIAGERGTDVRDSTVGHDLANRYRAAHRKALQECLIAQ